MSVILLILGLLLFVGLVVVHEFGHFIVARRSRVKVEEFAIGFPPRAWSKKTKAGFIFSLNWLPLGGFVRLKGEHDADTKPGTYGAANLWVKTKIMLAGVMMNLLTAYILLIILALVGLPKLIDNQFTVKSDTKILKNQVLVGYIEPNSPAQKAGLQTRDEIISLAAINQVAQSVTSQDQLPELTKQDAGQIVQINIIRNGKQQQLSAQLRTSQEVEASKNTSKPKGYLGISPTEYTLQKSTWSAPIVAVGLIKQFTFLTFQGLGRALGALFTGHGSQASQQVAGPVGIFTLLKNGSLLGYQFILMIVAIISLTLAIMNILPIPALDGGRLFVTLLFRLIRKPLKQKTEEWIHGTGFALLMVLFVLITIVDIRRL